MIMADSKEKLSYLHAASPRNGPRKKPRVFPFKLSECRGGDVEKEKRNVYLRIKPKAGKEEGVSFAIVDDTTLVPVNQEGRAGKKVSHRFKFTKIFGPKCNQDDIFKEACYTPLSNFVHGGNCFVFAYGATNAGKTFTIQGNQEKPGIIPRAINLLFNSINGKVSQEIKFKPDKLNNVLWLNQEDIEKELELKQSILSCHLDKNGNKGSRSVSTLSLYSDESHLSSNASGPDVSGVCPVFQAMKKNLDDCTIELDNNSENVYSVWVSYAEIYNENIYDLLQPVHLRARKALSLGENDQKEVFIKGLTDVCVCSGEEAFKVFLYGKHNLHQAATSINHVSSRSHSIFSIKLIKHLKVDCPTFAQLSMCSFVDLAGAERAKKTLNAGERMKESQCINTSLHVLGKCLETLRYNQKSKDTNRIMPSRESKLTRLFQRALEGKEVLTMIVNINQDERLFDETINVLKFSAIAMELQYDRNDNNSTVCSLRKSRFSQYMESFSKSFHSSMDNIYECPEDARYMKLLAYVEELKKKIEEEKKKNSSLEINVRREAYDNFKTIMTNMENNYKKRLREEREAFAEYEAINSKMYKKYLDEYSKRKQDSESESEDEEDEEKENEKKEDYIEKIQFLQNKVEALTALVESSENLKVDYQALQTKHSKLQFELSTAQQELEKALKISEAMNSGPDSTDNTINELQKQLSEQQLKFKEKTTELEEMKKLLDEAKLEFDAHFHEHEDFAVRNSELEKMIADRDEKIDDLQSQLSICNKKLTQQLQIYNSRESEEKDLQNKLQSVCEARDEYKFKVMQLESDIKKLQNENSSLKSQPKTSLPSDNDVRALEALVASHEDQIQKYKLKLEDHKKANEELQEELSSLKSSSVCGKQESYEKEISILEQEIKDTAKNKKELLDQLDILKTQCTEQKEALKIAEAVLAQEQGNTKEMRKICEAEKKKISDELLELKDSMRKLQISSESLVKDNEEIKLHNMELEEMIRVKEEQMDAFKARRDAQFESYENMLKHERQLRERDQKEVYQMQTAIRKLTPHKSEHTISDLQKAAHKCEKISAQKVKARRGRKNQDENAPQPSEDEIDPIFPEMPIKPDPDSSRTLRPRRKKVLYSNEDAKEELDFMRPKSSRRRPV